MPPALPLKHLSCSPVALLLAVSCCVLGLQGAPASAQQGLPAATGATVTFAIRGFDVRGDLPLTAEEAARVLAPYVRDDANLLVLQQAASALEATLRLRGYALHRVSLPPQAVGDRVRLDVLKFVVGQIQLEGADALGAANVRNSLPALREGQAPNFQTLAVQTAIANESPFKQVQVAFKESDTPDQVDVSLRVKAGSPLSLSGSASNSGSDATGNDRVSLVGSYANLFDRDQQLAFAYTSTLERSDNVKQVGVNYRVPLYAQGGVLAMSYTSSNVVGNFGSFTSAGAGETYGVNYNHYLPPEAGRRSYVSLALDEKRFDAARVNQIPLAGQTQRVSRPLTLGYSVKVESDTSVLNVSADVASNLPGGPGNTPTDYQSEDARLQTVDWQVVHLSGNYWGALNAGWLWNARGQLQYSASALIAGEQLGVGGVSSVRGTPERILSGDSGAQLSLELSTPELGHGVRLSAFADAGWLSSNNTGASTAGKPASDQLASLGVGLRYGVGRFSLSADWGHVVSGANPPRNAGVVVPKAGDEKLHINLTGRF